MNSTAITPEEPKTVIGEWLKTVDQNGQVPGDVRESARWRELVASPLVRADAAVEQQRVAVLLDWLWGTVLPLWQPLAAGEGVGEFLARIARRKLVAAAYDLQDVAVHRFTQTDRDHDTPLSLLHNTAWHLAGALRYSGSDPLYKEIDLPWAASRIGAVADHLLYATRRPAEKTALWAKLDPVGMLEQLISTGA